MKNISIVGMLCLGLTMLASCERSQSVQASSDVGYRPRAAPDPAVALNRNPADGPLKGEVLFVDVAGNIMRIRVENGMEQTVKWNNDTTVNGIPADPRSPKTTRATADSMKLLSSRLGSSVVVASTDANGQKLATVIQVTDLSSGKGQVKKRVRRIKNS